MRTIKEFMVDRWGLVLFVVIAAMGWGHNALVLHIDLELLSLTVIKKYCHIYLGSYVGLVLLSWSSYSKIYKPRIFLLGPLFMVVGIYIVLYLNDAYTSIPYFIVKPDFIFFKKSLLLLTILTLLFLGLLPTHMEYRLVRRFAWFTPVFTFALFTVWLKYFPWGNAKLVLLFAEHYNTLIYSIAGVVVLLSFIRVYDDNQLGGAFSGLIVFLLLVLNKLDTVQGVTFFLVLPFIMAIIAFYNWFHSLYNRARYDPLLRIYNRDYYQSVVEGKSDLSLGKKYCIAVCDLDHFKRINDRAGHQAGDVVLKGTAQAIKHFALPKGITCRYGGEELVIFFRKTSIDEAKAICETIRQKVALLDFRSGRRRMSVTVSIGVAAKNPSRKTSEMVVGAADKAVYKAKRTGRNKVIASK